MPRPMVDQLRDHLAYTQVVPLRRLPPGRHPLAHIRPEVIKLALRRLSERAPLPRLPLFPTGGG